MIYKFHGQYTEEDKKSFQKAQEEDIAKIIKYLNTGSTRLNKIQYKIYDSAKKKQTADPNHSISKASARYHEFAIYRFWTRKEDPHFPHEITHLVTHTWARPYIWQVELDTADGKRVTKKIEMLSTSFIQEGLSIAVDDIVFRRKLLDEEELKTIDDWCRSANQTFPELIDCINFEGFASFENKLIVPFSASLSKYLLVKFGLRKFKKMYTNLKETNSPPINISIIEGVYSMKADKLIKLWKHSIDI
ncbi:MAG: hypothetical protein ACC618_00600 [Patescibacteria group bacterium]